jgi:hypothetical protein
MNGPLPLISLQQLELHPDPTRTVIRPFWPAGSDEAGKVRLQRTVERIMAFDDDELVRQLDRTWRSLEQRHNGTRAALLRRAEELDEMVGGIAGLPESRRLLLGAYFSAEYAFEAAALFNPSIVRHPDHPEDEDGETRFILSLRGIGEGHLSSVTFRTGTWHADGSVTVDAPGPTGVPPCWARCSAGRMPRPSRSTAPTPAIRPKRCCSRCWPARAGGSRICGSPASSAATGRAPPSSAPIRR